MQRLNFSLIPRKGEAVKMLDYQQGLGENTCGSEGGMEKRRMDAGKGRKMKWDKFRRRGMDKETRGKVRGRGKKGRL